jgi:hypothetical protein
MSQVIDCCRVKKRSNNHETDRRHFSNSILSYRGWSGPNKAEPQSETPTAGGRGLLWESSSLIRPENQWASLTKLEPVFRIIPRL